MRSAWLLALAEKRRPEVWPACARSRSHHGTGDRRHLLTRRLRNASSATSRSRSAIASVVSQSPWMSALARIAGRVGLNVGAVALRKAKLASLGIGARHARRRRRRAEPRRAHARCAREAVQACRRSDRSRASAPRSQHADRARVVRGANRTRSPRSRAWPGIARARRRPCRRSRRRASPANATRDRRRGDPLDWTPLFSAFREAFEWALDVAAKLARDYPEEVEAVERVRAFMRARTRRAGGTGAASTTCCSRSG